MTIEKQLKAIEYHKNSPEILEEFLRETGSTDLMEFLEWILENKLNKV